MPIDKNPPPTNSETDAFLNGIAFNLPDGFTDFYVNANGAYINSDNGYTVLWPLTDMIQLNKEYDVDGYAPGFFIFGSDGGDTAFSIEKSTGNIYEMPFIGMSEQEAVFICSSFAEFTESR